MVVGSQAAGMGLAGHVVYAVCRKQNNKCLVVYAQLTFSILYSPESPTQGMTLPTTKMDLLMSMTIIKKKSPQACPEAPNPPRNRGLKPLPHTHKHIQRLQIPHKMSRGHKYPHRHDPHFHPGVYFPGDFRACQSDKTNHHKWETSCSGCLRCHLSWLGPSVVDSILTVSLTSFELQRGLCQPVSLP